MKKPSFSRLALVVLLFAAIAFLLYTLSSSPPQPAKKRRGGRRPVAVAPLGGGEKSLALAAPADAEFGRYEIIAARNVFSPPEPPKPPPPKQILPLPPIKPPAPPVSPPPLPPSPPPAPTFPGWSYLGYVEIDGKMRGILQNDGERTAEYVAVGEGFRGASVTRITATEIELRSGDSLPAVMSRTETFALTPLQKGAVVSSGGPAQKQQPAAGGAAGASE